MLIEIDLYDKKMLDMMNFDYKIVEERVITDRLTRMDLVELENNVIASMLHIAVWPDGDYWNVDDSNFDNYYSIRPDNYAVMVLPPELEANIGELAEEFANTGTWLYPKPKGV
jgi:hypothetical protein